MVLEVIVDISTSEIDRPFDYEGDDVPVGSRVAVGFGNKRTVGFVVGKKAESDYPNLKRAEYLDTPVSAEQLRLMEYMRENYNLRHIDVLRLFVPSKLRDERDPETKKLFLALNPELSGEALSKAVSRAKKQAQTVEYLKSSGGEYNSVLSDKFGAAAVKALRDKGVLTESAVHETRVPLKTLAGKKKDVVLTDEQRAAVDGICTHKGVCLLHGVTGSGKTEVYQAVIERTLAEGKTAIMLVPEISLTPQMLGIFRARFGDNVAVLHSGLNASERYDEWKRLRDGRAKIAIGARSAVFAPLADIGAIIIDEEHDSSYISESNPRYDTKTVAEFRAAACNAVLVLGSATPDIETYLKATQGKYRLFSLKNRISSHKLPEMEIVDMTREFRYGNRSVFSAALADAMRGALERKEQIMIFLNRRGFSSFIMCKECGYVAKCEDCDVSLTYHKAENVLKCHCCGRRYHALSKCPQCSSTSIKQGKVGTEKIVEELHNLFPDARVLRMDNDTTSRKDSYFAILDKFAAGKADILVGTQMIAKGHDFPNVTLVGILEADSALYFSDYRSSERTFQLVTQVAGRAGRADKKGRVVLQTFAPRHYVFAFASQYDYEGFWRKENNTRMVTKFPPYTKVVRVLVAAADEQAVADCTRAIYKGIKELEGRLGGFVYTGAAKSPVTRMHGLVRYQVLMRIQPEIFDEAMKTVYRLVNENKPTKGSSFAEINPQSLI